MNQSASRPQQQPAQAQQRRAEPEIDPNAALLDEVVARTIDRLDTFAGKYQQQLESSNMTAFRRAAMTAIAIKRLRGLITEPVMALLRDLMNTPLGFKTDRGPHSKKQPTPYGDDVIRDCAIEALLRGVLWSGNEFNIIAGQCYITREGYTRRLQELKGLANLSVSPGIPRIDKDSGRTVIRFAASWTYNGVADQLRDQDGKPGRVFVITVNESTGPDAIVGKAHRKAFKAVWDQIHGSSHHDREDSDIDDALIEPASDPGRNSISDAQEATLLDLIAEYEASPLLMRTFYGLQNGQRLSSSEFEACVAKIKSRDFSAPAERGSAASDAPSEDGDVTEYSAEEIDQAIIAAGLVHRDVFAGFGVKRAADLNQLQRRQVMAKIADAAG